MHRAALIPLLALALMAGEIGAQDADPGSFVGTWVGTWERGREHKLVVERVDGRKATFVYRSGAGAASEDIARARRHEGVIVGGVLYGKSPAGAALSYVMSADGRMLVGHYVREQRNLRGEFTRR